MPRRAQGLKPIPKFTSEAAERKFWESHDTTDYLDLSKAERVVLPNLKPSTQSISLRLPSHLLDGIKAAANKRDVPYQSLIKIWLQEKLETGSDDAAAAARARLAGSVVRFDKPADPVLGGRGRHQRR